MNLLSKRVIRRNERGSAQVELLQLKRKHARFFWIPASRAISSSNLKLRLNDLSLTIVFITFLWCIYIGVLAIWSYDRS